MNRVLASLLILGLAAGSTLLTTSCASTREPSDPVIVKKPHPRLAKASLFPSQSLPAERDGVPQDATGAIMFICAGSDLHEDKEVFINKCPSCPESNFFYWQSATSEYVCFACTKPVDASTVKCPDCGRSPRRVRTKPQPRATGY